MAAKCLDRPFPTYPVPTASPGRTAMGFPVSQTVNPSPRKISTTSRVAILLVYIVLTAAASAAMVAFMVISDQVPHFPSVKLTSVSTTVHNVSADDNLVTADLHAGFLLNNSQSKGMVFDHLTASAFDAEWGPLAPFTLCGNQLCNALTAWFRLNDVSFRVGTWDVVIGGGDDNGHVKSGSSEVEFGLGANMTYMGKAWSKRRIPLKIICKHVKIGFSYNASSATNSRAAQTVHFDKESGKCSTHGLWEKAESRFSFLVVGFAILLAVLLFMGVCFPICIHRFSSL